MEFAHLAQRMFNTPIAIHPRKAEIAMAALADRLGITHLMRGDGRPVPMAFDDDDEFVSSRQSRQTDLGYDVVAGTAIIPIAGTLVQKQSSLRPYSGMTGYNGIRQAFLTARADSAVSRIALDISSGGGEVAGCFDLVDTIHEARGDKPIAAILTESAYSAAYAIASAADTIYVPRTGGTGSIGVICMHVDLSEALTKAGLKVTFITNTGADRKTDGHSEIPLSKEALAAFQHEIDTMGALFHDTVARNRGIATSAVRDMRAGTFMGADGVTAGLADAVMAPDAAFAAFLAA
ncbi:S49 family peptidase [Sphingomonas sp. TX0522]|uniref:S49 family peptidase n=1 Tax=Sphingomonas sp. TX0522 TaxID=2479205 RepID=UPI0018E00839|nr:S49 family peptidase [Sphingomonas sp. TX0522]MBI0533272.1 S49 family peptidase [Sphingomonas sp. TX0522]